jgi:integrase
MRIILSAIQFLGQCDLGFKLPRLAGKIVAQCRGMGRVVPLTRRAAGALTAWLKTQPEAGPDAYVFPRHRVGFGPGDRVSKVYDIDFNRPMLGWKSAWNRARRLAGVNARWHDLRHTLVSRLAENPTISEETIRSLAGHVSRQMLSRYAHIRAQAKRAAIATLEPQREAKQMLDLEGGSPQKSPQSPIEQKPVLN